MRHRYADKQPTNGDGPLLIYYRAYIRENVGQLMFATEVFYIDGKWVGRYSEGPLEREAEPDDEWQYQRVSSDTRK